MRPGDEVAAPRFPRVNVVRDSSGYDRAGEVARWTIISGPREYNPGRGRIGGRDLGWAYVIERGNERLTVRVERDSGLAESEGSSEIVRRAVASCGRSAVEAILARDYPPARLIVTADSVSERAR